MFPVAWGKTCAAVHKAAAAAAAGTLKENVNASYSHLKLYLTVHGVSRPKTVLLSVHLSAVQN